MLYCFMFIYFKWRHASANTFLLCTCFCFLCVQRVADSDILEEEEEEDGRVLEQEVVGFHALVHTSVCICRLSV